MNNITNIVEGLLFLSPQSGIKIEEIEELTGATTEEINIILENIEAKFRTTSELRLIKVANRYRFTLDPKYSEYYQAYLDLDGKNKLSNSTIETLSIIAYKQPITRNEIEDIRGVSSHNILKALVDRELIYISGRKSEIGRPNLYSTTSLFLDTLGINTIEELPPLNEIGTHESELFTEKSELEDYKLEDKEKILIPTEDNFGDEIANINIKNIEI